MASNHSQAGFGYLELLAAMIITGIAIAASTQLYLGGLRVASDAEARIGDSSIAVVRAHLRQDLQKLALQRGGTRWQDGPLVLGVGRDQITWKLDDRRLIRRRGRSSTVVIGGLGDWRWRRRGELIELELDLEKRALSSTRSVVDQRPVLAEAEPYAAVSRPVRMRTLRLSFHTARGAGQW